ncbi:hypothetical protein [Dictyobacter arantiisoli]|uniref:Uncharacterized protein n=1 Tax=Dictyobacter arantiisoli TaxID=2014874 RepID=A0A5A5T8U9_9CHLR|nr:hypothetical protein [Dictyobacter arantiisoli]GCF07334.1 hypothetical protein KDI_08980 [Dictyobacter arantiisoli]
MTERPFSRYTREKSWAALYSQHINAGYVLIPHSRTNNSIAVIRREPAEKVQEITRKLYEHADQCDAFFNQSDADEPNDPEVADLLKRSKHAVVLARSSDYYHYHLDDKEDMGVFGLVICGIHDSYLQLPVWELRNNKRYAARETSIDISSPVFEHARKTQVGHSILLGALHNGDKIAKAFLEALKKRQERTYWRIRAEVDAMQEAQYRGRHLAFMTELERKEVGAKISQGLKLYYAKRRSS